ncbi:MAG: hypothetical protein ACI9G1_005013 [Pirellulaceae bacterium]|jgi:hypothetical protein
MRYGDALQMKVDIYVYDKRREDIRNGHTTDDVIAELAEAEKFIQYFSEKGLYKDVKKLGEGIYPMGATENSIAYQSNRYQLGQTAGPGVKFTGMRISETYVRGFRKHFLKIRITYPKDSNDSSVKARDELMSDFGKLLKQ